jgi:hypothetical protein
LVEGCFRRRNCKIRGSDGRPGGGVAGIMRKKAEAGSNSLMLEHDVLSLVVEPNVDCTVRIYENCGPIHTRLLLRVAT